MHAITAMNRYYGWSILFLSLVGLWPYRSKKYRLLINIAITLFAWTSVITQFLSFTVFEMNTFRVVKITSYLLASIALIIRYHLTCYYIDDMKDLLEQIKLDWYTSNDNMLQIIQKDASIGKRLGINFWVYCISSVLFVFLYHIAWYIISSINGTHRVKLPIDLYFGFDTQQHPILSNSLIFSIYAVFAAISAGIHSFELLALSHSAALFHIASYHFQKAVLEESTAYHLQECTNRESFKEIINGVFAHRKAIQFLRRIYNHGKLPYSADLIFGIIALSCSLFCLSQTVLQFSDIGETLLSLIFILSITECMFIINLAVQYTIDSASSISTTTYNTNWYETTVATQKLLQMVIMKSNRHIDMSILAAYNPSIEGFITLSKAAISYFTVLLSLK
ncbi:uncharacterized protein LOC143264769 [Megachile rotundata]|uniref:uncharacterized protein LOC143264769 n=1 Tax=Megachile rotundata TaxID=143995 RepID=UPI003FD62844